MYVPFVLYVLSEPYHVLTFTAYVCTGLMQGQGKV